LSAGDAQRLFFALWPDDAVRAALVRAAEHPRLARGRRVRAENLHVTLLFLGDTAPGQRTCAEQLAETVRASPFTLVIDQSGWWRRPQVAWVGCAEVPEALSGLVAHLRAGSKGCGFSPEERPFAVHVTVARRVLREPTAVPLDPIRWAVDRFSLVESSLSPGGSAYRVLRTWPLGDLGGGR